MLKHNFVRECAPVIAIFALLSACGTSDGSTATQERDDQEQTKDGADESDDSDDAPKTSGERGGAAPDAGKPSDAGKAESAPQADTAAKGGAGRADASMAAYGAAVPCEIAKILRANCGDCHGATPKFGAPSSLLTAADFQADVDGRKLHEVAHARVTATDSAKRMPPASKDALSAADLKTLSDWLKDGAKPGAACATEVTEGEPDKTMPIKGGSGGAHNVPVEYDDPDLKCHKLTSFQKNADKTKPYSVPTTPDLYVAFDQKAPWQGKQYVRAFKSSIDNADVVHHFLFFKQPASGAEKVTENAVGAHPEGQMLYGWAPGGDDLYFDPDVAMEVDGSVLYQLEMHYNNKTGKAALDASGVEICVTPNKPTHVAGLSWLGTDAILGSTSAVGRCAHQSTEPIHIISAQPHMHLKGRNMKVEVVRKSGASEILHDKAFSFEYQRSYVFDYLLQPGDVVNTTCSFSEPSTFGKGTNDEMCYFFTIHWPAGALSSLGVGTLIHGANSCMDI